MAMAIATETMASVSIGEVSASFTARGGDGAHRFV
jgi:hypothetical protein